MFRHTSTPLQEDIFRPKIRFMTTQDPIKLNIFKKICDKKRMKYSTTVDMLIEDYIRKHA
jgi:hypothetical protein